MQERSLDISLDINNIEFDALVIFGYSPAEPAVINYDQYDTPACEAEIEPDKLLIEGEDCTFMLNNDELRQDIIKTIAEREDEL